ncbi:DUF2690 domain-containing protein [Frondihabitans cladoniiphilus]|uniref:HTH cro/C1-type domain-containing protein n=1 Tax=Frondihabitans cladoniiphilus TaxID=715785 RepID=A0ABP8W3U9_9MICO
MTDPIPPDPTAPDTVEQFARDLRHFRLEAGNPTLAGIEKATGVSKSVVSDALAGRKLPSARTVRAVVSVLEGDVGAWLGRRDALERPTPAVGVGPRDAPADASSEARASSPAPAPQAPNDATGRGDRRREPRRIRLGAAVALVVLAFVVGVGATTAVGLGMSSRTSAAGTPTAESSSGTATSGAPHVVVKVGADPADTACVKDAVVAASETGALGTQLQIVWSASCDAAWARITRYDNASEGNEVSAQIFRKASPQASDRQETTEPDVDSAYTTLLVRPTPKTTICATGSVTVSGSTVDFGHEICL